MISNDIVTELHESSLLSFKDYPYIDHISHKKQGLHPFPDKLYVVTAISNPCRYTSRYNLYRAFEKRVADAGAILYTVEMAFGGRPFEVTESTNPRHIQVRGSDELWHKENLLNLGISRLPANAKYVAWIDADIQFVRPDWAQETIQQLQHYQVVQMFSHASDVGPNFEPLNNSLSWTESIKQGLSFKNIKESKIDGSCIYHNGKFIKGAWHSGLAWAARRSAIDGMGGLIDFAILGSADRNMAAGFYGLIEQTLDKNFSPEYKKWMVNWQDRTVRTLRHNIGQIDGLVYHFWHGPKINSKYTERWKILSDYQFNPLTDIKKDSQGIWKLEDHNDIRSIKLRNALREYFKQRQEDSISLKS
jgi:hypothetical protein